MRLRSLVAAAALASASLAAHADTITGVTFTGFPADPTITVSGSGFGITPPPSTSTAPFGETGLNYGTSLYLDDNTKGFSTGYDNPSAGRHDYIGLLLLNYSDTSITYKLGNEYTIFYPTFYNLQSGDAFTAGVGGTTFSGTVAYTAVTPEPSSLALLGTGILGVAGVLRKRFAA